MTPDLKELGDRKLALMRDVLDLTRRQLLLVDLEALTPLLEQKDSLIGRIRETDRDIEAKSAPEGGRAEPPPWQAELDRLVEAILDNERTMEDRLEEERDEVKRELRVLERQGQVKQYLEAGRRPGRSINLKR